MPSGRSRATRCAGSTPRARSPRAARSVRAWSRRYVKEPSGVTSATRSPAPSRTGSSTNSDAALSIATRPRSRRRAGARTGLELRARGDQPVVDAVELVAAIVVGRPQDVDPGEAHEIAEGRRGGLGHRHLAR